MDKKKISKGKIKKMISEFSDREIFITLLRQKDWLGRASLTLKELGELLDISATRVNQIAAKAEIRSRRYGRHHGKKSNVL